MCDQEMQILHLADDSVSGWENTFQKLGANAITSANSQARKHQIPIAIVLRSGTS